jgi:N-acetylmuramoyl-L-alanine amidase
MVRTSPGTLPFVASLCGLCGLCVQVALAAVPPPRTMYTDALAREQKVRAAMSAPDDAAAVLAQVRSVAARYELLVKHYPASGYSDDALWEAGRLLLDAYTRFGDARDRTAGVRLLKRLAVGYPTSKFAKLVPEQIARVDDPTPVKSPPPAAPPSQPPADAGRSRVATIRNITRSVLPDAVRVVIELDSEVAFHQERIPAPERVFLDLMTTRAAAPLADRTLRFNGDADVVRQVRVGTHPNNTTRVVLDAGGVASYSIYPLYGPYRLVIDCMREAAAAAAVPTPAVATVSRAVEPPPAVRPVRRVDPTPASAPLPLLGRRTTTLWQRVTPGLVPRRAAAIAEARSAAMEKPPTLIAELPAPQPLPTAALPPTPLAVPAPLPSRNSTGGFSIARQLGLGVSRIVIDPGHGGHDSGAQARGVSESELVLDVALRLEKLLQALGAVEVVLTRRTDDFIALQERTAIANREGADLFLSIHANANASSLARGVETYFLNFASNLSAAAVAARENAASGQAMGALPDFVKAIALNNKLEESREFAGEVQHAMLDRLRPANRTIKDLGVKQAPFVVLIGAAMPSVLAEISFVTNPQEAKLLKGGAYRQRIADALCEAIQKYQTSLRRAQAVASQ